SPAADEYLIDRRKFIGNYGDLREPLLDGYKAFGGTKEFNKWNESVGSLSWDIHLLPGEEKEIDILLGIEENRQDVRISKDKYLEHTDKYFEKTKQYWEKLLGKTYIKTPDDSFNYMMNYWLKYQTISARLVGRTGYYQTGGAFGFRDQLQDSQLYNKILPEKARKRILVHASRQYQDGAVQHWWHPISDYGMRNGISDNLLWLPYITYRYIMESGDFEILDEVVTFLDGGKETLKVHCEKAIERVWNRRSGRGLPLIGEGDWNDGLSAVGWQEKGESIWLGHFLVDILRKWSRLEFLQKNDEKAEVYKDRVGSLSEIINKYGWDGNWYIRATTDSGRVLGSKEQDTHTYDEKTEDQINQGMIFLNAQTWSILSGVITEDRMKYVQNSMEKYLYREYGPILFYNAFLHSDPEIGYITRYGPGTRENGGLYSHAACWAIAAECDMERPDKVEQLLKSFLPPVRSFDDADKYCAEPYVLPGNVDGPDSPNFGRGGWTWYTGSAAWLFTVGWDWIIGFMPKIEGIKIRPCLLKGWSEVSGFRYFRGRKINFTIQNKCLDKISIEVNKKKIEGNLIEIEKYGKTEELELKIIY
ncbi:GH36-type glycosyl hydrolase domain-containing protein, partial [Elusimicrobiota bacterium]